MSGARVRKAGVMLLVLLALPRVSDAGLIDWIWELSGPSMVSVITFDCEYNFTNQDRECRFYDGVLRKLRFGDSGYGEERKLWFTFGTAAYTSTGKDSANGNYGWFENHMLVVEPMLERRVSNRFQVGIGMTYNFVFGERFRRLNNVGVKVEPLAYTFAHGSIIALTGRFYPDEYTPEEFGVLPKRPTRDRSVEGVISLVYRWRRPPLPNP